MLTYLLDCVRRGNCEEIQNVLNDSNCFEAAHYIVNKDFSVAHAAFQYVLPQTVRASIDSGWATLVNCLRDLSKLYAQGSANNSGSADVRALFPDVFGIRGTCLPTTYETPIFTNCTKVSFLY